MIKPYYQKGNITIYCGDYLEIVPELDPVDLVLTDPPYGVGIAEWDTFINPIEWLPLCREKSETTMVFCSIGRLHSYPKPRWIVAWTRNNSTQRNGTGGFNHWEPVLMYGKGKVKVDMFTAYDKGGKREHPSVKPLKAFKWCIGEIKPTTILDPFMGSGTTLVAVKQLNLNRKAIGIDISEEYCEIAVKRLQKTLDPNRWGINRRNL